jgi:hypothetical protein
MSRKSAASTVLDVDHVAKTVLFLRLSIYSDQSLARRDWIGELMLASSASQSPIVALVAAAHRFSPGRLHDWSERVGTTFLRACVAASLRGGTNCPSDSREVELLLSYFYEMEPSPEPFEERLARALAS